MMAERKPWEMMEDERPKPFEAFCIYRDMGLDRTIAKVAKQLSKSYQLMSRWASQYNWGERVAAWDREQDRVARESQLSEIAKMRNRHAKLATDMLAKAAAALEKLPPDEVKASDVSRMVEVASKLERLARGDVGEVVEERDGGEAVDPVQIYIPDNRRGLGNDDFSDLEV